MDTMLHQFNQLSIRTKFLVCAITILILVGGMSAAFYIGIVENEAREQRVVRAADVVHSTDTLLMPLTNMELNFRGFLLTGSDTFLDAYEASYQEYQQEQTLFAALLLDDPEQTKELQQLDVAVRGWHNFLHQPTIRTRKAFKKSGSTVGDLFIATALRGAQDFDDIRVRLNAIRTIEMQRSDLYRQESQAAAVRLRVMLLVGLIVTSVLSLGALSFLASNIARRVQQVTKAATRIADGDNTVRCELPASDDEVGLMGATFNTMAQIIQQRTDDLVAQYQVAEAARCEAESTREQLATQLAVVDQQQAIIREMSVPILPVRSSTLVMPLVGSLDSSRLALMQSQALHAIERSDTRHLILDITGVPIIDTQVALGLTQLVQAARLLGVNVDIVGIRPEVAQAIVGLGVEIRDVRTFSNLQAALDRVLA
jgi:CHASE3 domain sensor protein/anti-anti-sigma regulatory factor